MMFLRLNMYKYQTNTKIKMILNRRVRRWKGRVDGVYFSSPSQHGGNEVPNGISPLFSGFVTYEKTARIFLKI